MCLINAQLNQSPLHKIQSSINPKPQGASSHHHLKNYCYNQQMVEGFGFMYPPTNLGIWVNLEIIPSPEIVGSHFGIWFPYLTVSLSTPGLKPHISCASGPPAVHWAMRFLAAILANAPGYNRKSRLTFWSCSIRTMVIGINHLLEVCYSLKKRPGEGSPTLQQFQGMSSILRFFLFFLHFRHRRREPVMVTCV